MMQPATAEMKAAHLHALAVLYFDDGQTERSLILLMVANLMAPLDHRILESLAIVALASGAPERTLRVIELLERAGLGDANEHEVLRKRALRLARKPVDARNAI